MAAASATPDAAVLESKLSLTKAHMRIVGKKAAVAAALTAAVEGTGALADGVSADVGLLLFTLATKLQPSKAHFLPVIGSRVVSGAIDSSSKLTAALSFAKASVGSSVDEAALDEEAGVGVHVDADEIAASVGALFDEHAAEMAEQRYIFNASTLLVPIRARFPRIRFADGKAVKNELDARVLALLGPRTDEDDAAIKEAKKAKKTAGKKARKDDEAASDGAATPAAAAASASGAADDADSETSVRAAFEARDLASAANSDALLASHAAVTGGVLRTRFPPEPNGFLHIGHAKSMNLNFKLAFALAGRKEAGDTIFRYDDTNPEAESQEYIDSQADNVSWLGWAPCRTTHSSDYFAELHDLAVRLVREGKAYVCHQTAEQMAACRELRKKEDPARGWDSPWRGRSVEENLAEFAKMREGRYKEGQAVLRLRMDWDSPNPNLWDIIAYRIKFHPHPRTGSAWCMYPSYDFTHCIVDSLEHIDLSLCTLEFEPRRDSYYWLLEALGLWRPRVWEFSRLNIARNVLSKRKILKLVQGGTLRGWDDPRLLTINGLRRRGYPAEAVNAFCDDVGVTRAANTIRPELLEHHARAYHDACAPRALAVLRPLRVVLTNLSPSDFHAVEAPVMPKDPSAGTRTLPLSRVLYIEESDFRDADERSFFGLAPGKTVGLRYAGLITCDDVVRDASGAVTEVRATYSAERTSKPKGNLHWVSSPAGEEPVRAEVRLYSDLFSEDFPGERTGNFMDDLCADSEEVVGGAMVEPGMLSAPPLQAFQCERLGYFVVDPDTTDGRLVLNRTVTLRESTSAKAVKA